MFNFDCFNVLVVGLEYYVCYHNGVLGLFYSYGVFFFYFTVGHLRFNCKSS